MTACKDSRGIAPGKRALGATLAGALAAGMVPAAALAAEQPEADGIEALALSFEQDFAAGKVTAAKDVNGKALDLSDLAFTVKDAANGINVTEVTTSTGVVVKADDKTTFTTQYVAAKSDGSFDSAGTLSSTFPTTAGTYYAVTTVTAATGDFKDYNDAKVTTKFVVENKSLEGVAAYDGADVKDTTFTYTGKEQTVNFKIGDTALTVTDNYTVKCYKKTSTGSGWENVDADRIVDAGTYKAVLTGANDYAGSEAEAEFTVEAVNLADETIAVKKNDTNDAFVIDETASSKAVQAIAGELKVTYTGGTDADGKKVLTEKEAAAADATGTFSFTVAPAKESDNITGSKAVEQEFCADGKADSWAYGDEAFPTAAKPGQVPVVEVDHSDAKKPDFDPAKVAAKDANGKALAVTYKVYDEEGNEVDAASVKTAGTWTVKFTLSGKDNGYKYTEVKEVEVHVIEGTVDSKDVVVSYDGKLVGKGTTIDGVTFDGTDKLGKLTVAVKAGDKTLEQGVDYTVTAVKTKTADGTAIKKDDQVATTEAVDAGTYTVTIASDSYEMTDETFTLTIGQVEVDKIHVAGLTKIGDNEVFLYTGEAITPVIEYQVDDAKDTWAELPADVYTATYNYKAEGTPAEVAANTDPEAKEIKEVGNYLITVKASKADAAANYKFGASLTANVQVSDQKFFYDVTVDDWFYLDVYKASSSDLKYMNGYGDTKFFGPNNGLTRAEAAQVLFNMAGGESNNPLPDKKDLFSDVAVYAWYGEAIAWAQQAGIVTGYGDGTFKPEQKVTREEFATMLARYAKVCKNYEAGDGSALAGMSDAASVSGWAAEAVDWAVEGEYMGANGWVAPQADITRAEVAKMVVAYQPEPLPTL